jgi:SAM-dependent methyltransferase
MRLADLERDYSQMFPGESTPDASFLYARMAAVSYELLRAGPGARVIDAAAGVAQDARELAARGARAVAAEPSGVMLGLGAFVLEPLPAGAGALCRVRAWAERLPFAAGAFDAALCKGALDHFDDPLACIAELARVTRPGGRVVLAVANMDSLGLRWARARARWSGARVAQPGRRHWDVPGDHLTRYEARLLLEHAQRHLLLEECVGISLLWGEPRWGRLLAALPARPCAQLLGAADWLARRVPSWADVIALAGRPRQAPPGARSQSSGSRSQACTSSA